MQGRVGDFNMWDSAMSEEVIMYLSGNATGNFANTQTLSIKGTRQFENVMLPAEGKSSLYI